MAIESPWQRRLAELKLQMSDIRATYGSEHPLVVQQEARIATASETPTELQQLRKEEQALLTKIQSTEEDGTPQSGGGVRISAKGRRLSSGSGGSVFAPASTTPGDNTVNPALVAAMAELQSALAKYTDLAGRADSARLNLTIAQVAFRHRYVLVSEPEIPRKPMKRMRMQIELGSVAGALLLALLIGALRDLVSGRILDPWQLKQLGLQVLGELQMPKRAG